jgi:hypothetical protein
MKFVYAAAGASLVGSALATLPVIETKVLKACCWKIALDNNSYVLDVGQQVLLLEQRNRIVSCLPFPVAPASWFSD